MLAPTCDIGRQICKHEVHETNRRCGRGRPLIIVLAFLTLSSSMVSAQDASQGYYGIRPGISTKAQVDLSVGEPLRKLSTEDAIFEYPPAKDDSFSRRLVLRYEGDTSEVARLDAYLKTPLALSEIRDRFGTRVVARDRADGGREEVYFPQLQALVLSGRSPDAPVVAVSHLSPRTMGLIYVARFDDLIAQKNFDEARTEADKAVVVDPDGAEGYLAQGRYFVSQRDYNEALVRLTAASNAKYSAADKYRVQIEIARVHEALSAPDKAQAAYRRAIDIAPPPDRPDAHYRLGLFLNGQKKVDEAIVAFAKAVELNAKHLAARRAIADAYFGLKDYTRALPYYEGLGQEAEKTGGEKDGLVHFRYAYSLKSTGKDAQAVTEYDKALQLPGTHTAAALNNRGLLHVKAGHYAKGIDDYRAGLQHEPKDVLLNRNLAEALLQSGQAEEARQQAELTASLKPDDQWSAFTVAKCWGALKKNKETVQWLQRAVSSGFSDRQALTTNPFLSRVQGDKKFKLLLAQVK